MADNKRCWQIVYSRYEGLEKKAVDLVSTELGSYIIRDAGVYSLHVLPCAKADEAVIDTNAVILGVYGENAHIRRYIEESEIPEGGYIVKVIRDPECESRTLALITAKAPQEVFYGAVDFVDDYFAKAIPEDGCLRMLHTMFDEDYGKLPLYTHATAPRIKRRCVFTWGHPINDYRNYIENMARLKLNQLIIWNDFVPINAKDIVDYAHEYGIQLIWGYAWGWSPESCKDFHVKDLEAIKAGVLEKFEREYAPLGVDGIYFQSFTENTGAYIEGRLVADMVTDFVNETADALLARYPDLYIQFGLHAQSVKDHLSFISKVDPRIEIMWEDCGEFPFSYVPKIPDPAYFASTEEFVSKIVHLRGEAKVSMLMRGFTTLAWQQFVPQKGSFVLGKNHKRLIEHDRAIMEPMWRHLQTEWMMGGGKAVYDMTNHILSENHPDIALGMAGQFAGGLWYNEACCAEILWDPTVPYEVICERVAKRRSVEIV